MFQGTFTAERAALVPQIDRLGKKRVWHSVERLMQAGAIPNAADGRARDITDGQDLRWWLWICNLGGQEQEVIGAGIHTARLAMNNADEVVFTFIRADDTECSLTLCCLRRGTGLSHELRVFV